MPLSLIVPYLRLKYGLQEVTKATVEVAQKAALYSKIEAKEYHKKLYGMRQNENADAKISAT